MADEKVTLQHLNHSQSQQILWLLEELSIAYPDFSYSLKLFERQTSGPAQNRAPPNLKETHPLGKSPQLITPAGRVIIERSAIALYLINTYDTAGTFKLNPSDPDNDAIHEEELLSLGGSSLNPILTTQLVFDQIRLKSPFFIRPLTGGIGTMVNKTFLSKENESMIRYLDDQLQGRDWFMSTPGPTRSDFSLQWYIDMGSEIGIIDLAMSPNLKAWLERCKIRPAWKKALEKGNGYDMKSILS